MCAGAAEAMAARQAATPLYERLNGREGIHAVITDVVRRHQENEQIKHMMEGVDPVHLADQGTYLSSADIDAYDSAFHTPPPPCFRVWWLPRLSKVQPPVYHNF